MTNGTEDVVRVEHTGLDMPVPDLMELQRASFRKFLQDDVPPHKRENVGLEAILSEIFPINSYDGSLSLEYLGYDLGRPRYSPDECRQLRLTFGAPFKIRVRLMKDQPLEEEVYLGEIPIILGGGEFIINGAERVIVNQLHRSPGVDFNEEIHSSEKRLHTCRIIPERGSWIELNVSKRDVLQVRIDQSGKFPVTCLLRAMGEEFGRNEDIIRLFHETSTVKLSDSKFAQKVKEKYIVTDVVDEKSGEFVIQCGEQIQDRHVKQMKELGVKEIEIIDNLIDPIILHTIADDTTASHKEALLRIYSKLRPGNPPQIEKARELFFDKFFNPDKYRLGRVGRFRLNRKFGSNIPETEMTLNPDDIVNSVSYILELREGRGEIDDIDHLGNRRIRTIDELAGDEFRKGFLKLKRTVQERMSLMDPEQITPRGIINSKTISSAIDYFFGRSELSQVVDQTNPLSQLTHERRLSALGPGGLNRKRAGFEVRDVHISHYGRICPIETPEGTNIGLISSLSIYARIDEYGFLITPYKPIEKGVVKNKVLYLRADEELGAIIAPADTEVDDKTGAIKGEKIMARLGGDYLIVEKKDVKYIDVSPKQVVGVSASLIPFLEHNDANRALMGSNMQRQAVPLLNTEPPIVATGMEKEVASNSGMVVKAENEGVVRKANANEIVIGTETYDLRKFVGLNDRSCLNQKPVVKVGDKVEKGQIIADGAATSNGELALGKNVLVAFLPFDGYNFEDAVIVSQRLVRDDVFTSIHIDEFEIEIRETKLGREEFTRDIPNVSEKALANLDEDGVVAVGTKVGPGDILVGKVVPKSKSESTPEEKLLHAIFGRAGEDVKNDSLEVPSGVEGIVIDTKKFSRRTHLSEDEKREIKRLVAGVEKQFEDDLDELLKGFFEDMLSATGKTFSGRWEGKPYRQQDMLDQKDVSVLKRVIAAEIEKVKGSKKRKVQNIFQRFRERLLDIEEERIRQRNRIERGDELPTGVLEMVKVYVATKRVLSVGDKVAGRHGNKGVIAKIMPMEDMPYLADGTPIDVVLNPLGVPSRMNVGQILETHLGWAANKLGFQAVTPVFRGFSEEDIQNNLKKAGLPEDGKVKLHDGRTGEAFEQKVTVGYMYILKLHHLVDDKIHARATGPYSLITQQPLGGKARFGGQRFGEMEVWALDAYGAANVLQELLTVKSDDVDGRTKIYESMVKGENTLEPGTPVSYDVLTNEIRGLCLNMELNKKKVTY